MSVTTRASKGFALTYSEMDGNFTGLADGSQWTTTVTASTTNLSISSLTASTGTFSATGGTGVQAILISGSEPRFSIRATTAAANNQLWDFTMFNATPTVLRGRIINDADSAATDWLRVTRSGTSVSTIYFGASVTASSYAAGSVAGTTFSGAISTITVINGIVTAVG